MFPLNLPLTKTNLITGSGYSLQFPLLSDFFSYKFEIILCSVPVKAFSVMFFEVNSPDVKFLSLIFYSLSLQSRDFSSILFLFFHRNLDQLRNKV